MADCDLQRTMLRLHRTLGTGRPAFRGGQPIPTPIRPPGWFPPKPNITVNGQPQMRIPRRSRLSLPTAPLLTPLAANRSALYPAPVGSPRSGTGAGRGGRANERRWVRHHARSGSRSQRFTDTVVHRCQRPEPAISLWVRSRLQMHPESVQLDRLRAACWRCAIDHDVTRLMGKDRERHRGRRTGHR